MSNVIPIFGRTIRLVIWDQEEIDGAKQCIEIREFPEKLAPKMIKECSNIISMLHETSPGHIFTMTQEFVED